MIPIYVDLVLQRIAHGRWKIGTEKRRKGHNFSTSIGNTLNFEYPVGFYLRPRVHFSGLVYGVSKKEFVHVFLSFLSSKISQGDVRLTAVCQMNAHTFDVRPEVARARARRTGDDGATYGSCSNLRQQKSVKMASIKFGSHIKELRILLCQTSKSSQGVR